MSTAPSSAPDTTDTTETAEPRNGFDRFFEITRRGSTDRRPRCAAVS